QADMRVLFVRSEPRWMQISTANLANDQHVRVIPMSGPGKRRGGILAKTDSTHAAPCVGNVARFSPGITANGRTPFPDVEFAVLAKAENDVARLLFQIITHFAIRSLRIRQGTFAVRHNIAIAA